jgi:hypothetical protein
MELLLLEAFGAAALLVFIVWWVMFSGRSKGEPPSRVEPPADPSADAKRPGAGH